MTDLNEQLRELVKNSGVPYGRERGDLYRAIRTLINEAVIAELEVGLVLRVPQSSSQHYLDGFHAALDQVEDGKARRIAKLRTPEALPNHEGHQGATTPAANPDQEAKQ